jgi:hypothetical protein
MDRIINFEPASGRDADIKKAIDAIFAEMRQMDERIARDQAEIERLRLKTRKKLDELKIA